MTQSHRTQNRIQRAGQVRRGNQLNVATLVAVVLAAALPGCVSVKAPEQINVGGREGSRRIDTSRVPPTANHEEARQRLAEAYQRIQYLEDKVRRLEVDKAELKQERDRARAVADRDDDD